MKTNEEFQNLIKKKHQEMKKNNIFEDFLDKNVFGELKVFINKKPKYSLSYFEIGSDLVYFGSESF